MSDEAMFKYFCVECEKYVSWKEISIDKDFLAKEGSTKRVVCKTCDPEIQEDKLAEKIKQLDLEESRTMLDRLHELKEMALKRHTKLKLEKEKKDKWDWIKNNLGSEVIILHGTFANLKGVICIEHNQRNKKYVNIKPIAEEKKYWNNRGNWRTTDYCCVKFLPKSIGMLENKDDKFTAQINEQLLPQINKILADNL